MVATTDEIFFSNKSILNALNKQHGLCPSIFSFTKRWIPQKEEDNKAGLISLTSDQIVEILMILKQSHEK